MWSKIEQMVHYICLETKTFGPKAQGLSRALTLQEYLDAQAKYNIIQYNHCAMSARNRYTPCAADNRQPHPAKIPSKTAAENMIKIRDK